MSLEAILEAIRSSRTPHQHLEQGLPNGPGLYAIYLDDRDEAADTILEGHDVASPLYVGKAESSLRQRDLIQHFTDCHTGRSTVRRSLGAILRRQLGLKPIRRSNTGGSIGVQNYKFDAPSERHLSEWMRRNLSVGWWPRSCVRALPDLERQLIEEINPPLNLQLSSAETVRPVRELRRECRELAEAATTSSQECS